METKAKRGKISVSFLRFVENKFEFFYSCIFILGITAAISVILYLILELKGDLFKDTLNIYKIRTTSLEIFSISAGLATFVGVLLAIAEIRLKFEKITKWKDLLSLLERIVKEAEDYIVMLTWYPTVGMASMKKHNSGYSQPYISYKEAIYTKLARGMPIIGIFLDDSLRSQRIEALANRMGIDASDLKSECEGMVNNLSVNTLKGGKLVATLPDVLGFHLFFNEKEGVIFVPLNLDPVGHISNRRSNQGVDFIGNFTMDKEIVEEFQNAVKYYKDSHSLNIYLPFE
jgi:hypothetical protein